MYRLTRVSIQNFRLLRKRCDVRFSKRNHVVSITGVNEDVPNASSNMSGKTTFANAITWCLYGCDLTGAALAGNVASAGTKVACSVTLTFHDDGASGRYVIVQRERNNSTTTLRIVKSKGKEKTSDDSGPAAQMQTYVDALFGMRDVFMAAHVFGYDESYVPFALSGDREQKKLFDLLVESSDLDAAYVRATTEFNTLRDELTDIDNKAKTMLDMLKLQNEQRDNARAQKQQSLKELAKEYKELKPKEAALFERCTKIRVRLQDAREDKQRLLEHVHAQLIPLQNLLRTHNNALNTMQKMIPHSKCPTCKQVIDAQHRIDVCSSLQESIEEVTALVNAAKEREREVLAIDLTSAENELRRVDAQHKAVDHHMTTLRAMFDQQKKASTAQVESFDASIKKLRKDIRDLEYEQSRIKSRMAHAEFWRTAFGPKGIRAMRLEAAMPILNAAARKYSRALFGDGQRVAYSTTTTTQAGAARERFDVSLIDAAGDVIDVRSAGQSLRRDVVNVFALAHLAHSLGKRTCSLLILDEAFRTLDAAGVNAVCELIQENAKDCALTLIIEHNEELMTRFDESIVIARNGGESAIRELTLL